MYAFTRITGVLFIILGIFLILAGIALGIYGLTEYFTGSVPGEAFPPLLAPGWLSMFGSFAGAIALFVQGLLTAALGQLMLIFVDIAKHTQETVLLLQRVRPVERHVPSQMAAAE
jgi:hypothetical protein